MYNQFNVKSLSLVNLGGGLMVKAVVRHIDTNNKFEVYEWTDGKHVRKDLECGFIVENFRQKLSFLTLDQIAGLLDALDAKLGEIA